MRPSRNVFTIIVISLCMGLLVAAGASADVLQWDPSTGTVTGYKIFYGTSAGTPSESKDVGNVTTYSLDSLPLSENVQYYFCVSAYNSAGESEPCPPVAYTPGDTTPPIPPVGLMASIEADPAPPAEPLTLSNLSVDSGKSYQVRTDLANGKTVYIDRSFTFSNLPDTLKGAAYIMTANDDKQDFSLKMVSFNVNRDVTVYVAHDDRLTDKPDWLKTFKDSGLSLSTDAPMTIYQKSFPAGVVSLGGNEGVRLSSMYTIAVK